MAQEKLVKHATKSNGDCLFESIAIILKSTETHRNVANIRVLRDVVASTMLDPENDYILDVWKEIFTSAVKEKNFRLRDEFSHAQCLYGCPSPYTDETRRQIYRAMRRSTYWGEQYALSVFEKQMHVRFIIFSKRNGQLILQSAHSGNPENCFAMLLLEKRHYNPLSYLGQFVFVEDDLPFSVRRMLDKNNKM